MISRNAFRLLIIAAFSVFIAVACGSGATEEAAPTAGPAATQSPAVTTAPSTARPTATAAPAETAAPPPARLRVSLSKIRGPDNTQVIVTVRGLPVGEAATVSQAGRIGSKITSDADSNGVATATETFYGCTPDSNPLTVVVEHGAGRTGDPAVRRATVEFTITSPECFREGPVQVALPALRTASIDSPNELDSFTFSVEDGVTYAFEVFPGTLVNPTLQLFGVSDLYLGLSDNYDGLAPRIEYTAVGAADLRLEVAGFSSSTGTYTVSLKRIPQAPVVIDKIIEFPFTLNNLEAPDLAGHDIRSASIGASIAIVGTGFSPDANRNRVVFEGRVLPVWATGPGYIAVLMDGPAAPLIGDLSIETPSGFITTKFLMGPLIEATATASQRFLEDLDNQLLADDVLAVIRDESPHLVAQLNGLAEGRLSLGSIIENGTPAEKAAIDSFLEASGILPFFQGNSSSIRLNAITQGPLVLFMGAIVSHSVFPAIQIRSGVSVELQPDSGPDQTVAWFYMINPKSKFAQYEVRGADGKVITDDATKMPATGNLKNGVWAVKKIMKGCRPDVLDFSIFLVPGGTFILSFTITAPPCANLQAHVDGIEEYIDRSAGKSVATYLVSVVNAKGAPLPGATVVANIMLPTGFGSQYRETTNADGIAEFRREMDAPGTYELILVLISGTGVEYDPSHNNVSSARLELAEPISLTVVPLSGPPDTVAVVTISGLTPFSSAAVSIGNSLLNLTATAAGIANVAFKMSGKAGITIPISVSAEGGAQVLQTEFTLTPPLAALYKDTFQVSIGPDARSGDFSLISGWIDGPVSTGTAPVAPQVSNNISPPLSQKIQNAADGESAKVFVNLADPLTLPLFPSLPPGVSRTGLEALPVIVRMQSLIDDLTTARLNSVFSFVEKAGNLDITPISTFWLINGFTADVPLELINELAAQPDVIWVQLDLGEGGLPQAAGTGRNGVPGDELRAVRDRLNSDPYDDLGLNWGYIGIIDSGVRSSHQMLSGDPFRWTGDCVKGGNNCWGAGSAPNGSALGTAGYTTGDVCNHGTSTLSIIRGSDQLGVELRGITRITTDSWRVFESHASGSCGATASSVARAVQKAITSFDSVIVIELQEGGGPTSAQSITADNAFDVGAAVISAAGNQACHTNGLGNGVTGALDNDCNTPFPGVEPDWRTVKSPGDAQKVIAVGAQDLRGNCPNNQTFNAPVGVICAYSGRGPSDPPASFPLRADQRYKPDILGYTNVEAASSQADDTTWSFSGTSAATPTIGALAMLYHNWMQDAVPTSTRFNCPSPLGKNNTLVPATPNVRQVCPGHVYAFLLNSATNVTQDEGIGWNGTTGPTSGLNITGAGLPTAPTNAWAGWGEWAVSGNQTANIPLKIPVGSCNLNTTIWWPERFEDAHSNLDLRITAPAGTPGAIANSRPSVWERQSFPGALTPGGWVISINATDVTVGSQPFYFAWSYNIGAGCP